IVVLRKFWITRGFAGEGARWISAFMAATNNSMGVVAGKFMAAAGAAANYQGSHLEAADLFGRALKSYLALRDTRGIADMLGFKGAALSRQGYPGKAKPFVERALNLAREIDDRWLIGDFLVTMATVAHHLGHADQSFALNREAVEVLMGAGNRTSLACALNNLGVLEANAGQVVSAKRKLSESLALAIEVGAEDSAIRTLESFAEVASLEE